MSCSAAPVPGSCTIPSKAFSCSANTQAKLHYKIFKKASGSQVEESTQSGPKLQDISRTSGLMKFSNKALCSRYKRWTRDKTEKSAGLHTMHIRWGTNSLQSSMKEIVERVIANSARWSSQGTQSEGDTPADGSHPRIPALKGKETRFPGLKSAILVDFRLTLTSQSTQRHHVYVWRTISLLFSASTQLPSSGRHRKHYSPPMAPEEKEASQLWKL